LEDVWQRHQNGDLDSGNESDTEDSDVDENGDADEPLAKSTPAVSRTGTYKKCFFSNQ